MVLTKLSKIKNQKFKTIFVLLRYVELKSVYIANEIYFYTFIRKNILAFLKYIFMSDCFYAK